MQPHDTGAALKGVGLYDFKILAKFNRGTLGVFRGDEGTSPWEMHPEDDELLQVIEGEVDITVLTDSGRQTITVKAGSCFVVPRGHWHRHEGHQPYAEMFLTPGPSEHSSAEDPRQA